MKNLRALVNRAAVRRVAERQHGQEDEGQQNHADRKTGALTEGLRQVDHQHNHDDEVDAGHEGQDEEQKSADR